MSKNKTAKGLKHIFTGLVMELFEKNATQAFNYKQASAKLGVPDEETRQIIREILQEQVHSGVLKEVDKGRYMLKSLKTYAVGKIDMASNGSGYLVSEELDEDVYIAPRKLHNALHGDTVKAHIHSRGSGKKFEGEVIEILERGKMEFTGIIQIAPRFAFLVPDDKKMMHDIFIPLESLNHAKDGEKAIAKITEWPKGAKNPIGEIIHVLGKQGEANTEMHAILADFGFPLTFPEKVIAESEAISTLISESEIAKRRDFRPVLTFTIDPVDAKDFDDAISFKYLDNGNYEIGVHIADVSHYVLPDSTLDVEAFERGTSVYLVDRVIPMLPEKLSNELCSLRPNEDKLCYSAVFEINDKAEILSEWFGRTIIHSDRRFSYEEVQEILDNKQGEFIKELTKLNELAYLFRNERFSNGAINFETTEVKFKLDENGKPLGVYVKERKDSHKLIEDFMLLANRKVAEFISKKASGKNALSFVYRAHDAPDTEVLANFSHFASRFGYKINTKSHRDISRSLNFLMADVVGKKEQNVLTQLAIRSMAKAIYTTKKASHYGLAFDHYTHFTSPIRRYPDVLAHRLLELYLHGGRSVDQNALEKLCIQSSVMEKKAADAERASIKYKQAEFLQNNIGTVYSGLISGVTEWGIYVEIIENKCEGMVRMRDIDDDFYVLDQVNYCIIGQRKKRVYQLGDEVQVKVKKVDLVKRQIDFLLITK